MRPTLGDLRDRAGASGVSGPKVKSKLIANQNERETRFKDTNNKEPFYLKNNQKESETEELNRELEWR